CSRFCLSLSGYRCPAAERPKRRHCGRFRWQWQPDGFRSARGSHDPYQGHHLVRHHLHGDLDHAFGDGFAQERSGIGAEWRWVVTDADSGKASAATFEVIRVSFRESVSKVQFPMLKMELAAPCLLSTRSCRLD